MPENKNKRQSLWFSEVMSKCWIDSDKVPKGNTTRRTKRLHYRRAKLQITRKQLWTNDGQISNTFPGQLYFSLNQNRFHNTTSKYVSVETSSNQTNKSSKGRSWYDYCLAFTCPKHFWRLSRTTTKSMAMDSGTQSLPKPKRANNTCETSKEAKQQTTNTPNTQAN